MLAYVRRVLQHLNDGLAAPETTSCRPDSGGVQPLHDGVRMHLVEMPPTEDVNHNLAFRQAGDRGFDGVFLQILRLALGIALIPADVYHAVAG